MYSAISKRAIGIKYFLNLLLVPKTIGIGPIRIKPADSPPEPIKYTADKIIKKIPTAIMIKPINV